MQFLTKPQPELNFCNLALIEWRKFFFGLQHFAIVLNEFLPQLARRVMIRKALCESTTF